MSQTKKFVSNIFLDIMGWVVFLGGLALSGFITKAIWGNPFIGITAWFAMYSIYRWLSRHWRSARSARE